jgi:NAD(P)-dependent dehydrogenase (short-subunit alcohol dehydrogenase family)
MDVNLRHHFIVAQESIAHLEPTSGSYAAVGSINGLNSSPTSVAYGVAKAGLVSMVRTFAWELAPRGIRFNVIAPGIVRTARAIAMGRDSAAYFSMVPLGRLAEPEDVGASALYLLSELGRHVTGQVLVVDGGSTVNHCLGNGRSD